MPALSSSPVPTVLAKLAPLDTPDITDLRPYPATVPDPRSRRGRWYPLHCLLTICACAVISGARTIEEIPEWGQRTPFHLLEAIGVRPHPLRRRRSPAACTIDRVLTRIDASALDTAVCAYLTDRHRAATENTPDGDKPAHQAIAVDGKALKGSARTDQAGRHLLSRP